MKKTTSRVNFKSKSIYNYIYAQALAYKIFTDLNGVFNENILEGFLEFIVLNAPKARINLIISIFESAYCSISKGFLESLRDQLKIRVRATKSDFYTLYKMNSWYRFIYKIIISKVANSNDEKDREIYEILSKIQNFWVYLKSTKN